MWNYAFTRCKYSMELPFDKRTGEKIVKKHARHEMMWVIYERRLQISLFKQSTCPHL